VSSTTAKHPTDPNPHRTVAAALAYARRGWHVFPLIPGDKRPAVADWEHRASTSDKRIHAWFAGTHARAGIGIACGPSRLVVIDLDRPKPDTEPIGDLAGDLAGGLVDGLATLRRLASTRPIPKTWTVATASGGWHLYYATPTTPSMAGGRGRVVELRNTTGSTGNGLGPLVDTRAAGGYVVAPPTVMTYGGYRVARTAPVAALPDWIHAALTDPHRRAGRPVAAPATAVQYGPRLDAYTAAAVTGQLIHLAAAQPGRRNHALYVSAVILGELAAAGALDPDHVRAVLIEAAGPHIAAGAYTTRQAHATITSGLKAGARNPRRLSARHSSAGGDAA
jgi:hypothetical protein